MGFLVSIQKAGKLNDLRAYVQGTLDTPAARRKYLVFFDQFHPSNPHFFPSLEVMHKDEALAFTSKAARGFSEIINLMAAVSPDTERGTPEESEYIVCQLAGAPVDGDPKATDPPSDLAGTADELKKRMAAKKREEKKAQASAAATQDESDATSPSPEPDPLPEPLPDSAFRAESLPLFEEPEQVKPTGDGGETGVVQLPGEPQPVLEVVPAKKRRGRPPGKRAAIFVGGQPPKSDRVEAGNEPASAGEVNNSSGSPSSQATASDSAGVVMQPVEPDPGVVSGLPSEDLVGPTVPTKTEEQTPTKTEEPARTSSETPAVPKGVARRAKKNSSDVMRELWMTNAPEETEDNTDDEDDSVPHTEVVVAANGGLDSLGEIAADLAFTAADMIQAFDKAWKETDMATHLSKFLRIFGETTIRLGLSEEEQES